MGNRYEPSRRNSGYQRRNKRQRSGLPVFLFYLFFIAYALGGLYFGYVFLYTTSIFLGTGLGLGSVPAPPGPFTSQEQVATWSGKDRLNILLLGLDQREAEQGQPSRSDTMIVLTIDPVNKTAAMLSIPRDLWVTIPGQGENKINTAHFFGELQKKDYGPILAKKTVEQNFGIPIHYYARVNFKGFEKLVDAIGGIDIDVPSPVIDNEYPADDGINIKRVFVPAGWQHMNGETALEYARSRHSDNDFGRNHRQQQVLVAAKNRALQVDVWPKIPQLIGLLKESVTTDIPTSSLMPIAQLAKNIDSSNITSVSIDSTMTTAHDSPDIYYLEPDWPEIKALVAQLFTTPQTTTGTTTSTGTVTTQHETARVEVLNGTTKVGLAAEMGSYLKGKGYVIERIDDADRNDYKETKITYHGDKATAANNIATLLGLPSTRCSRGADSDSVDITIVLGSDAKVPSEN